MSVSERYRLNIDEFAQLLGKKGYSGDSMVLQEGLKNIPKAKSNLDYIRELSRLTALRILCYKIAAGRTELKSFLESQALLHLGQPV